MLTDFAWSGGVLIRTKFTLFFAPHSMHAILIAVLNLLAEASLFHKRL